MAFATPRRADALGAGPGQPCAVDPGLRADPAPGCWGLRAFRAWHADLGDHHPSKAGLLRGRGHRHRMAASQRLVSLYRMWPPRCPPRRHRPTSARGLVADRLHPGLWPAAAPCWPPSPACGCGARDAIGCPTPTRPIPTCASWPLCFALIRRRGGCRASTGADFIASTAPTTARVWPARAGASRCRPEACPPADSKLGGVARAYRRHADERRLLLDRIARERPVRVAGGLRASVSPDQHRCPARRWVTARKGAAVAGCADARPRNGALGGMGMPHRPGPGTGVRRCRRRRPGRCPVKAGSQPHHHAPSAGRAWHCGRARDEPPVLSRVRIPMAAGRPSGRHTAEPAPT